jgi:hypothetical protein
MNKEAVVVETLNDLRARLGSSAFQIVDHWETDRAAIGVARHDQPDQLVYFCSYGDLPRRYFVSLEAPAVVENELPYTSVADHHDVDFEALVGLVAAHLDCRRT